MTKVTIEIDAKWVRIVHSPLMWIVGALQGVALTFAPLFLYFIGKGIFHTGAAEWFIVPFCLVTIWLVGLFYFRLGGEVLAELRKRARA